MALEVFLIFLLLLANGVFAMAEFAVVSVRKARLQNRAQAGDVRARVALELANAPTPFLSTVQVGITLVGILAGAFGGTTLAERLGGWLDRFSWLAPHGHSLALGIVVALITFFSLVIGELVPKRIALHNPEGVARLLAGPMRALSRLAGPMVRLLTWSSDLAMNAIGLTAGGEPPISEDEVRAMIDQGLGAGVFEKAEKEMLEGVLRLDELTAYELMTPRARMVSLNLDDPDETNWRKIVGSGHSQFPVYQGKRDDLVGIVTVKALWANASLTGRADLRSLVERPLVFPDSITARRLLEEFRSKRRYVALVVDEFGGIKGLVTLHDVMEAIVGQLPEREQRFRPTARRREDGSWLIDAALEIDEVKRVLGITSVPGEASDQFTSLGGFLIHHLGYIPKEGERLSVHGYVFEVVDTDRMRLDKILVRPAPSDDASRESTAE